MKKLVILLVGLAAFCAKPVELTKERAEGIIRSQMFSEEPIYAEVPQKVIFGPRSPKDDFDEKSVLTLRNLEREGLITVTESRETDGTEIYIAKVTQKGFPILGTMPSARGPVYRGRICNKVVDGTRNFLRHPNQPSTGRVEVVWHYDKATPLYPLFETKMNKPLKTPFISVASIYYDKGWRIDLVVKKTEG